ncbi:hypothetical protein [Xenorhabdus lircayensis]|uniref:Uncharacterized protein n=1 Tax=Xenorhabdus lircayensis TaxID=2763499 RepID=A0ABS0U3W1_9GAMM|nr:hypothetical protein [Xenorhabdus lircayensis]MBI6548578.1 hypothetical protein [Xenorhabdus lircayensis]
MSIYMITFNIIEVESDKNVIVLSTSVASDIDSGISADFFMQQARHAVHDYVKKELENKALLYIPSSCYINITGIYPV